MGRYNLQEQNLKERWDTKDRMVEQWGNRQESTREHRKKKKNARNTLNEYNVTCQFDLEVGGDGGLEGRAVGPKVSQYHSCSLSNFHAEVHTT